MDKLALFERLLKFADFPLFSNPGERRLKSNLDEHYYYKREKLSHYFHECCETFQFLLWNISINVVKYFHFNCERFLSFWDCRNQIKIRWKKLSHSSAKTSWDNERKTQKFFGKPSCKFWLSCLDPKYTLPGWNLSSRQPSSCVTWKALRTTLCSCCQRLIPRLSEGWSLKVTKSYKDLSRKFYTVLSPMIVTNNNQTNINKNIIFRQNSIYNFEYPHYSLHKDFVQSENMWKMSFCCFLAKLSEAGRETQRSQELFTQHAKCNFSCRCQKLAFDYKTELFFVPYLDSPDGHVSKWNIRRKSSNATRCLKLNCVWKVGQS